MSSSLAGQARIDCNGDRSSKVESRIVIPVVVGSNPIGHPKFPAPQKWRAPQLDPQSTPSSLFAAVQEAALAQIAANRTGVLRSRDPEYLHQLRVGLRRLRSALRAFEDLLPKKQAKLNARRIRRVMREIGPARDWDVFVQFLEAEQVPREVLRAARRECARVRTAARQSVSRLSLNARRFDLRSSVPMGLATNRSRSRARRRPIQRRLALPPHARSARRQWRNRWK